MLKAHWNENIHYCTLKKRQNGFYNFCIEGGSDNGQLIVLGSLLAEPVEGKAIPGSVILEINQIKISGCTQSDVQLMVDRYDTLLLTLTFPGQTYFDPDDVLTTDIRAFLSNTFYVNSPEEYLQQTIRANLFRKVSLGKLRINSVTTDSECIKRRENWRYNWVPFEDFQDMDQKGELLEVVYINGNFYGTPKPPKIHPNPLRVEKSELAQSSRSL